MNTEGGSKRHAGRESWTSDDQTGEAALNWAVGSRAVDGVLREVEVEIRRSRRRRIRALAGGLAVISVAALVWYGTPESPSPTPFAVARSTAVPSSATVLIPARQVLPDGSVVELNVGSEIAVEFTTGKRRVTLVRGEAHFEVARDAAVPFVVEAGEVEARAIGTAFFVQLTSSRIEVIVTDGTVAVVSRDLNWRTEDGSVGAVRPDSPGQHVETAAEGGGIQAQGPRRPSVDVVVSRGNRVVIQTAESAAIQPTVQPVSGLELQERMSWRVRRLEFSGTPLAEVIPLFNEHGRVHLVLGDPSLGRLQLSGILRADNIESLLGILELEFGIVANRRGEEVILVPSTQAPR